MKHFAYFPTIEYGNYSATNLLVRAKIRDAILQNTALYYKYTVTDGQRPDIISYKYYGNPNYTWAIFYANNIFDPVLEWPMEWRYFQKYLIEKYGSLEAAYDQSNPHHYEWYDELSQQTLIIDQRTYNEFLGLYDESINGLRQVKIVTNFDYENEINEARRNIVVLDRVYVYQIVNELSNIFDE